MPSKLFIGLGNPGSQYQHTRHNLGIHVLQAWVTLARESAISYQPWADSRFGGQLAQLALSSSRVTCLFPTTFMNKSGQAVSHFLKRNFRWLWHKPDPNSILIIHDELELPLGSAKLKLGGSARGHNGVKSIQQALARQDIPRLLLGISPSTGRSAIGSVSNFVLGKFSPTERRTIDQQTLPAAFEILDKISRP